MSFRKLGSMKGGMDEVIRHVRKLYIKHHVNFRSEQKRSPKTFITIHPPDEDGFCTIWVECDDDLLQKLTKALESDSTIEFIVHQVHQDGQITLRPAS